MSNLDCIINLLFYCQIFRDKPLNIYLNLTFTDSHYCIKNAMRNMCIYVIIVFAVTYRPNGLGVSLSILYYIFVICYNTYHYNELFTYLLFDVNGFTVMTYELENNECYYGHEINFIKPRVYSHQTDK